MELDELRVKKLRVNELLSYESKFNQKNSSRLASGFSEKV